MEYCRKFGKIRKISRLCWKFLETFDTFRKTFVTSKIIVDICEEKF